MNYKEFAENYRSYIIERRRHYHAHPELSGKEYETIKQMYEDIKALGITDIRLMEGCCGLIADIHGTRPGKTIALRADIDALPIAENTGLEFTSNNPGVMHACGHDGHMAVLLGAAAMLKETADKLPGTVRLLVQPSEEYPVGASMMIKEGAMDGVDAVYGSHVWGDFPEPFIDFSSGNRMACADIIKITVEGVAAHGSAPNLGVDAITASAAIINAVQQVVSRQNDPLNPMVVTIGTINGGSRFNVIANKVFMDGTTRTFLKGTAMEDMLRPVIEGIGESLGVKVKFEYCYMTPPVINEYEDLNAIARDIVTRFYGSECLGSFPPMMGGEDFSFYTQKAPGVFGFFGTGNPEKGYVYTNHNEKYDYDESVLIKASAVMAQFAFDYLNKNAK